MFCDFVYFFIVIICSAVVVSTKCEGQGGLLVDISHEQNNKLDQFREQIVRSGIKFHDHQKKDGYLIRWLSADGWDIELAAQSLYKAQEWRKNENIDSILNETIREPSFPNVSIDGVDYEGRPVMYTEIPDLRTLILQGKKEKLLRYRIQTLELLELKLREISDRTGRDVNQGIAIHDFSGFNLRQTGCRGCIDAIMRARLNVTKLYPRLFSTQVFVNVPRSAEFIFNTITQESRLQTRWGNNIKVFGSNKAEWSKYLLEIIPANQLSTKFGGIK